MENFKVKEFVIGKDLSQPDENLLGNKIFQYLIWLECEGIFDVHKVFYESVQKEGKYER